MTWQSNLFNNLLVLGILVGLALLMYCKSTGKTLKDIINDLKGEEINE